MPASFQHTMRALDAERSRGALVAAAIAGALGAGWIAWMTLVDVPVYRTSEHARLEVQPAPTRVATIVAGRIADVHLQVGARVAAGDVLVALDVAPERGELARARDRLTALDPQLASLDEQIAAESEGVTAGGASGRSAIREQLARARAADTDLAHAETELARTTGLVEAGVSPTAELDRAKADVAQKRAEREALGHAIDAQIAGEQERDAGRRAKLAELARARAEIAASVTSARDDVVRLELELERRVVRAPVAGVLGSVATLRPGAVIAAGDPIATVVPDGTLHVVADYGAAAIGRLAPGEHGRLRLDSYPWTRWGTVPVRVTSVASEVRDGAIRVELAVEAGSSIALANGMTGEVDVEVERETPAGLVVRSLVGDR